MTTVSYAQEVSLSRHVDCAAQLMAAHAMLTSQRDSGSPISFSQVDDMRHVMETTSFNLGVRLRAVDVGERDRLIAQFNDAMAARQRGLVIQAERNGADAALQTAQARANECLSELGSLATQSLAETQ